MEPCPACDDWIEVAVDDADRTVECPGCGAIWWIRVDATGYVELLRDPELDVTSVFAEM